MGGIGNQDEFLKEREQLLTDKEILEWDRMMLRMNDEIMERAGDIINILRKPNSVIQTFRGAYCQCKQDLEKTKADLENRTEELNQEKNQLQKQIQEMNDELAKKEKDVKEAKDLLSSKTEEIQSLTEKICSLEKEKQQYKLQQEGMPALMRLYHAYQGVMKKKSELPRKFFECMQSVVPLDGFDGFLPGTMRESYPVSFYQSVQSFITVCNYYREVSRETLKDVLCTLDTLLSAVFDLGSVYWEAEKLFRIDIEAGDLFDCELCVDIDGKGDTYRNIVKVLLHGFQDKKNDKIYHSYVEEE